MMTAKHKESIVQKEEYDTRKRNGEKVSAPAQFPNPRQIDTFRLLLPTLQRQYDFGKNLSIKTQILSYMSMIQAYDFFKQSLMMQNLAVSRSIVIPTLTTTVDPQVSATPVVIVDPSNSLDPRLASMTKAAKVDSSGNLSIGSGLPGLNVNITGIANGAPPNPGILNATLVTPAGISLKTFGDSAGNNNCLAVTQAGPYVTQSSGLAPTVWTMQPQAMSKAFISDATNNQSVVYGSVVPVLPINAANGFPSIKSGAALAGSGNGAVAMACRTTGDIGDGYNDVIGFAGGSTSGIDVASLRVVSSISTGLAHQSTQDVNGYYPMNVPLTRFTSDSKAGTQTFNPIESVSATFTDGKSNTFTGTAPARINVKGSGGSSSNTGGTVIGSYANGVNEVIPVDPSALTLGIVSSNHSLQTVVATAAAATTELLPAICEKLDTEHFASVPSVERIPHRSRSADPPLRERQKDGFIRIVKFQCPKCADVYEYGSVGEQKSCSKCKTIMGSLIISLNREAVETAKPQQNDGKVNN